ncbi:DNA-directed RNA polymerase subunit K [Candidatus Parvarchaeota archaeon]|nr:DNA-directed RNA polymerase subunit K [Candidatus Parvarchaeota archaeon]
MNISKYEKARIIGARALQLISGAPPLVEVPTSPTAMKIAEVELEAGAIPLVVLRQHIA